MFDLRYCRFQVITIRFCNEENTEVVIQGKPEKKRKRKVREKSTKSKHPSDQSHYSLNISVLLERALEVMANNGMVIEMFWGTVNCLLQLFLGSFSNLSFLNEAFQKTVAMKSFCIERMWTNFNSLWVNENITSRLIECFDVPKEFFSWLLLHCQEEIAKDY